MIVVRRSFAIILVPLFIVLFLATMLVFRVNATFLNADFYVKTIHDLDVFNFMYDQGIPYAIQRAEANGDINLNDLPLGVDVTPTGVAADLKTILPPDWLEANVSSAIEQAVPYITGDTDTFDIKLALDDRVEAATGEIKNVIQDANVHDYLVNQLIPDQIQQRGILNKLPFGLTLTTDQIVAGVTDVVPDQWLKDQMSSAIDAATPYLLGRTDTFSVTIPLQERADAALVVLRQWLLDSVDSGGAYDYLLQDQIAPVIQNALGSTVQLPYGVTFTHQEIVDSVGQVLTRDWVAARVSDAIDAIGPYLTGRTDNFVLTIPLTDRLSVASSVLAAAADTKFEQIYNNLPFCTPAQLVTIGSWSLSSIPPCRPSFYTYQDMKNAVGLDVSQLVAQSIIAPLPKSITLNNTIVFAALGATGNTDARSTVELVRDTLKNGYTFTQDDLTNLIRDQASSPEEAQSYLDKLDQFRTAMHDGIEFTQNDLHSQASSNVDFATFDSVRHWVHFGRTYLWLLIILPLLIAFLIGVLGGRNWWSRMAWAGVPLLVAGAVAIAAFGPVTSYALRQTDTMVHDLDVPTVIQDKILEVRDNLRASFIAPMATEGMVVAGLGLVMIVAGTVLSSRRSSKRN